MRKSNLTAALATALLLAGGAGVSAAKAATRTEAKSVTRTALAPTDVSARRRYHRVVYVRRYRRTVAFYRPHYRVYRAYRRFAFRPYYRPYRAFAFYQPPYAPYYRPYYAPEYAYYRPAYYGWSNPYSGPSTYVSIGPFGVDFSFGGIF